MTEEEAEALLSMLKSYTDNNKKMSKYQAYRYLNISRATFDNYVRAGKLPKGKKEVGFKELFWLKKDLNKILSP